MVVFMVCLLAFALTTLSLSFYVSQAEQITNPDVLSWNSILMRISKLDFCLQPVNNSLADDSSDLDSDAASISVPISQKFIEEFWLRSIGKLHAYEPVLARGKISMNKLGRHLSRYENQNITLTFEISKASQSKQNEFVCMYVQGPKLLLADLNSGLAPQNCSQNLARNLTKVHLNYHSQDDAVVPNWCDSLARNETPMVLEFVEQPDWSVFVSPRDKEMMQLHLLVTSVFIFAVLLTVVLGIVIRTTASLCRNGGHVYAPTNTVETEGTTSLMIGSPHVERG